MALAVATQAPLDPVIGDPIVSMPGLLKVSQKYTIALYTWKAKGKQGSMEETC
jgi:hypothetical protein